MKEGFTNPKLFVKDHLLGCLLQTGTKLSFKWNNSEH